MESNDLTVADYNYTVILYLDDESSGTAIVSWTVGEIPATEKKITFSGLDLGGVDVVDVEVEA